MARAMKDSGIEWIGEIPENWDIIAFWQAITRMGTGLNPRENFELSKDDPLYYVTIRNFKDGKLYLDDNCDRISHTAWSVIQERSDLHTGDILFASISKDGQAYIIEQEPTNWNINESVFCIRVDPQLFFVKYFYYHLINKGYYDDLRMDATGSTFQSIKQNKLKKSRLVLPPLSEQRIIAYYLDSECARIDAVIEQTRASIEEYKKLKQAVITQAVTKGIRPNRPMKDSGIAWIGEIPFDWSAVKLKWLCERITDGSHFSPESIANGFPYITAKDIHGKGIDYKKANRISEDDFLVLQKNGCQPHKGDVFLVKDGATTGRVGVMTDDTDCVILSSVAMLTPSSSVSSLFLYYLLQSNVMQKQITISMAGSAMPRITLTKLIEYYGIQCSLSEQLEIVEYLDKKCTELDKLILSKESCVKELESYKKSLIYEYVTGKKEVPAWP